MGKQEIVEVKPAPKRKLETKNKINKLRLATEIKLDKVRISLYHDVDVELMDDVWELVEKYAG